MEKLKSRSCAWFTSALDEWLDHDGLCLALSDHWVVIMHLENDALLLKGIMPSVAQSTSLRRTPTVPSVELGRLRTELLRLFQAKQRNRSPALVWWLTRQKLRTAFSSSNYIQRHRTKSLLRESVPCQISPRQSLEMSLSGTGPWISRFYKMWNESRLTHCNIWTSITQSDHLKEDNFETKKTPRDTYMSYMSTVTWEAASKAS